MSKKSDLTLLFIVFCAIVVLLAEDKTPDVKEEKQTKNVWHEVSASRIGLVGNTTYSGVKVTDDNVFVALPSKKVQKKYVKVCYKKTYAICQVLDLGPWSRNDPYWENNQKPKAEKKISDKNINNGVSTNASGIDLSDGLWKKLGIKRGLGIVKVRWKFIEEQDTSNNNCTPCIND